MILFEEHELQVGYQVLVEASIESLAKFELREASRWPAKRRSFF